MTDGYSSVVDLLKQFNGLAKKGEEELEVSFYRIDSLINNARREALQIYSESKASTSTRANKRRTELNKDNKENKSEETDVGKIDTVKSQKVRREIGEDEAPKQKRSRKSRRRQARTQETDNSDKESQNRGDEAVSLASGPRTRRFTRLQAKLRDDNTTSQPKSAMEKIRKTEVLKKVKAHDEKCISLPKVSTLKVNEGASSSRSYVSVSSPVKLRDKKLSMNPRVMCTPVDYKRIVTTMDKTQENVEKRRRSIKKRSSIGLDYILKSHTRRSCRISNLRSNRLSSVQREKLVADSAKDSVFEDDETDSGSNKLRLSSTDSDGASEDEQEISSSPMPTTNKKTRQVLTKVRSAKGSVLHEQKSSGLEASSSKKRSRSRIFSTPSSASKLSRRFVSPKILEAKLIRERQEKLSKKEEKSKQTQSWRKERLKMQVEETKRNRALKLQKVMERRCQQEEERQERALVRSASKERPRVTPSKSCDKLTEKLSRAKNRRTKEEELRQLRLQEKEEERRRKQQERMEREAMREQEEKRRVDIIKQRMMTEEAKKKKELEELQRQADRKQQQIKREKAEHERTIAANEATKEIMSNATFETTTTLNTTYTGPKIANPDCYDMTLEVIKPIPLKDPNNYDIADLNSEDSTDDESNPRKYIPLWAQSRNVKIAARLQIKPDFDLDELFPSLDPPDLIAIFSKPLKKLGRTQSRFFKRTSSANWSSPVRSHNLSGYCSS